MAVIRSNPDTLFAGVSLASSQWRMGIIAADGDVELPSGQGVQCDVIIEAINDAGSGAGAAGSPVQVRDMGKIELGETMSPGAPFTVFDSTGVAGVAIAGDHIMGKLLHQGGAAGEVVPCKFEYAGIL